MSKSSGQSYTASTHQRFKRMVWEGRLLHYQVEHLVTSKLRSPYARVTIKNLQDRQD